jgi:hypothetical protein
MEKVERELAMHVAELESIFLKNPGRFLTTKEIAGFMGKATWSDYSHMRSALDIMVQQGQLGYDKTYGYCRRGEKAVLLQQMSKPSKTRSEFDKMSYTEQSEFCRNGGRVV